MCGNSALHLEGVPQKNGDGWSKLLWEILAYMRGVLDVVLCITQNKSSLALVKIYMSYIYIIGF